MTERVADRHRERRINIAGIQDLAERINNGSWLKEKFPDKDWHQHRRGESGTQWCDGTSSDCKTKARL